MEREGKEQSKNLDSQHSASSASTVLNFTPRASDQVQFDLQGGIGPAGLATEDLHVLDFTELDKPRWHRCLFFFPIILQ